MQDKKEQHFTIKKERFQGSALQLVGEVRIVNGRGRFPDICQHFLDELEPALHFLLQESTAKSVFTVSGYQLERK